jgi:hypothetical protein
MHLDWPGRFVGGIRHNYRITHTAPHAAPEKTAARWPIDHLSQQQKENLRVRAEQEAFFNSYACTVSELEKCI